jgi:hypothetical protein
VKLALQKRNDIRHRAMVTNLFKNLLVALSIPFFTIRLEHCPVSNAKKKKKKKKKPTEATSLACQYLFPPNRYLRMQITVPFNGSRRKRSPREVEPCAPALYEAEMKQTVSTGLSPIVESNAKVKNLLAALLRSGA